MNPQSCPLPFLQLAVDDAVTTAPDTPVDLEPLVNDISRSGTPLTIDNVFGGQNGVCVLGSDNTVTYTPNTDFDGTDVCLYTVCDGNGKCDQAVSKYGYGSYY